MGRMKSTDWILADTETTGLSKPIYCIELAAVRMRGTEPVGVPFRALLNHDVDIEPAAEAIHGYSRAYLRKHGKDPRSVYSEFAKYAEGLPLVTFNLAFDWGRVLQPELSRLGLRPPVRPGFCALTLARRCIPESDGHSLDKLRSRFFPAADSPTHQAASDTEITRRLFTEVMWPRLAKANVTSFDEIAEFSRRTPLADCRALISGGGYPEQKSTRQNRRKEKTEDELIGIIEGILADDELVDAELWALRVWIDENPAVTGPVSERTRALLAEVFSDGLLSENERRHVQTVLMDLIPQSRNPANPRFESKGQKSDPQSGGPRFKTNIPERGPYESNATRKQKEFLWDLGCQDKDLIASLGKRQAADLISQLTEHHNAKSEKSLLPPLLFAVGVILAIAAIMRLLPD